MTIEIEHDAFIHTFRRRRSRIYKQLQDSLLPFKPGQIPAPKEKNSFLEELYNSIVRGTYFPGNPRGYLVENKHNGVPRFVPVLSFPDNLIYYFCSQQLMRESYIEKVANTYGGFQLGSVGRSQEDLELQALEDAMFSTPSSDSTERSLDPKKFRKIWRDYQRAAYLHSRDESYRYFITLDIANFYDSINLELLERRLRAHVGIRNLAIIDLMFVLLGYWNRSIEGYGRKTVGLPLEEIGDNSRLFANFFLAQYDREIIKYCQRDPGALKYVRFADDQILMARTKNDGESLLFFAADELRKIGLSINSGKVIRLQTKEDFDHYWCFENFRLLDPDSDADNLNRFATEYFRLVEERNNRASARPCRLQSMRNALLFRIALPQLGSSYKRALIAELVQGEQLTSLDRDQLRRVMSVLTPEEAALFDDKARMLARDPKFNRFAFVLKKHYGNRDAPDWLDEVVEEHLKRVYTS